MSSLQRDPSGNYHACFRLRGQRFKRSLHTDQERNAYSLLGRIDENLRLVERGKLRIPDGADIPTFLLSDGQIAQPLELRQIATLGELIDRYEASLPRGALEESTRYTIRIHSGHLKRVLGEQFKVAALTRDDLQRYVNTRAKDFGIRKKSLSPVTIRKEVTTLSGIWTWAEGEGLVGPFPNKGLKYPKASEKPPFQTWKEIERQIQRGRLSEEEQSDLWDCLFLNLEEISDLLEHVKRVGRQPFIYPMFVLAAHTGARRSELVRSRLVDLGDDTIQIRERKRAHGRHTTRRVPLSSLAREVIEGWLKAHPGGPFTFCQNMVNPSVKSKSRVEQVTRDEAHDHFKRTLAGLFGDNYAFPSATIRIPGLSQRRVAFFGAQRRKRPHASRRPTATLAQSPAAAITGTSGGLACFAASNR
jgi:integrase